MLVDGVVVDYNAGTLESQGMGTVRRAKAFGLDAASR
jgi:hypothetical protein